MIESKRKHQISGHIFYRKSYSQSVKNNLASEKDYIIPAVMSHSGHTLKGSISTFLLLPVNYVSYFDTMWIPPTLLVSFIQVPFPMEKTSIFSNLENICEMNF